MATAYMAEDDLEKGFKGHPYRKMLNRNYLRSAMHGPVIPCPRPKDCT